MNLKELSNVLDSITEEQVKSLEAAVKGAEEIFLIGNGGSNAIASHMAVDYTKFLSKRCFVPNASDLMTMIVNDYGRVEMYARFIEYNRNFKAEQLAIIISSSGNSANIIAAVEKAHSLGIPTVLLSGFEETNALNKITHSDIKLKYWVDSKSYGVVEMAHHSFLHAIV